MVKRGNGFLDISKEIWGFFLGIDRVATFTVMVIDQMSNEVFLGWHPARNYHKLPQFMAVSRHKVEFWWEVCNFLTLLEISALHCCCC